MSREKVAFCTKTFQKKAKSVFGEEIMEDEKKLRRNSKKSQTEKVRKLLSIGLLDVDCVDEVGGTPLHMAADEGHKDEVQLLLDKGADPNKANVHGWTPLHNAANKGHKDVVQLLLDRGADPNKASADGQTPLTLARDRRNTDIANLLTE